MSNADFGSILLCALAAVILAPAHYLCAEATQSLGLLKQRLRLAFWLGLALGPLGLLVMHRLPPGDPERFDRDLGDAYCDSRPVSMAWSSGITLTVLGTAFGYYILASLMICRGLPLFPLWVLGLFAFSLGFGYLCHRSVLPPVTELPAPALATGDSPAGGSRLAFNPVVLRQIRAARLSIKGAWMLIFLLVLDGFAILTTSLSSPQEDLRKFVPLTIIIAVVLVVLIVLGFTWGRYLLRMLKAPGQREHLTLCTVCRQRIIPGEEWVLRPGDGIPHHPRCMALGRIDVEQLTPAEFDALSPADRVVLTEPGRACRGCGQFVDPFNDAYEHCPECGRTYHRSCYGTAETCTYCAGKTPVPAVAERIAREKEEQIRVPTGAYNPGGREVNRSPALQGPVVCRSCGEFIGETDSRVACIECRRTYHTVCMASDGKCGYCAAGEDVPEDIEAHFRDLEQGRFQQSTGNVSCPFCETELRDYGAGYRFCPYCGAELGVPEASQVVAEEQADTYADNLARGLEQMGEQAAARPAMQPEDAERTTEERHGWLKQDNMGCVMLSLTIFLFFGGRLIGRFTSETTTDLILGFTFGWIAVGFILMVVQWVIGLVRARIWPMPEPSPQKWQVIRARTLLWWVAGVAAILMVTLAFPDDGALDHAALFMRWVTLGSGTGAALLSLYSLFIR